MTRGAMRTRENVYSGIFLKENDVPEHASITAPKKLKKDTISPRTPNPMCFRAVCVSIPMHRRTATAKLKP